MTLPHRRSLAGRLLLSVGLATFLPLVLVMAAVLFEAYQATTEQTYGALEQTSRRYAADFGSRLQEKLGLIKAIATFAQVTSEADLSRQILALDPDLKEVWIHREGTSLEGATPPQRELYLEVRSRQTEVLSSPDFERYQASLGFPILESGQFAGVVSVSFSLSYFQEVVTGVHLLQSGYALLVSHDGYRIAHPNAQLIGVQVGNDVPPAVAKTMLEKVGAGLEFHLDKPALLTGKWSRQYYSPVSVGRAWNPWFFVVVVPTEEATGPLNSLFLLLAVGVILTSALVAATTWLATRSITRPLRELALSAEAVAQGHFDTRVSWSSADEVGILATSFNRMTDRLVRTLRDQEEIVRRRTARLVDSEKMAVLGQLTATIAHEVNTPLGAIRSSATFLHQNVAARVGELADLFRNLTDDELELYRTLMAKVGQNPGDVVGAEARQRQRRLAQGFRQAGVDTDLADDVVFLVGPQDDAWAGEQVLSGRGSVLRLAARTAALIRSCAIILEASDRAASTVAALVDYSRVSDVEGGQTTDPAADLDTVLTLYHGLARRGVQITREYQEEVRIRGDRDRLNQVWSNLINNALQAMEFQGHLHLRVRQTDEGPEVAVFNTGPAILPAIAERMFEPFFTTKEAGQGAGLGLDVCRRIVEAHAGRLEHSREGEFTVFTARFPQGAPEAGSA